MVRAVFIIAWLLALPATAGAKSAGVTDFNAFIHPGRHEGFIRVDDHDRRFLIFTPEGATADHPRPVVFFFHGAGGFAEQAARTYGWVEKAQKERFFLVFPEGLGLRPDEPPSFLLNPRIWRDGRAAVPGLVNDAAFFSTLLDKFEAVLPIDQRRVYVTGFSNGAGLTFALGGKFSDRIAAIAPVSSQSFAAVDLLARPLPVYYLVGDADPLIPYQGGTSTIWGQARYTPPVQQSVDHWAELDGCPPMPQVLSEQANVKIERYGPGRDGSEVIFTVVRGNGHHWPTSPEPLPHLICGPTLDPFSATDRIWDFFLRHPLPH